MESPVVVSEDTERSQLIDDIKATCAEQETTLATFGGKAKTALNLEAKTSLRDAPIETLRVIHANRMAIIAGTYQVGGEA
jgi:ribosomal protein L7Ae-like RNA K-turn-binding protein